MADNMEKKGKIHKSVILIACICLSVAGFFISIGNGAVKISPREIIDAIVLQEATVNYQIIWNVRLPRTIAASLVGTCLCLLYTSRCV